MLLQPDTERDLINALIEAARMVLTKCGEDKIDQTTGLVTREYRGRVFIMVEHQRQRLEGGDIETNGLDIWRIQEGRARKSLSVNYLPFHVKFFDKAGKAGWIGDFHNLAKSIGESAQKATEIKTINKLK